ncbi:hypothetical protein [Dongshaea marina]|uniref:hypothetical protein n=1 Tax=Dongshaea marina TaxID=2047966 RepID=UPI000D3EAFED|nr:hypothetical protein [Dongshaea marina]
MNHERLTPEELEALLFEDDNGVEQIEPVQFNCLDDASMSWAEHHFSDTPELMIRRWLDPEQWLASRLSGEHLIALHCQPLPEALEIGLRQAVGGGYGP